MHTNIKDFKFPVDNKAFYRRESVLNFHVALV